MKQYSELENNVKRFIVEYEKGILLMIFIISSG